jgi:hypothetical protein
MTFISSGNGTPLFSENSLTDIVSPIVISDFFTKSVETVAFLRSVRAAVGSAFGMINDPSFALVDLFLVRDLPVFHLVLDLTVGLLLLGDLLELLDHLGALLLGAERMTFALPYLLLADNKSSADTEDSLDSSLDVLSVLGGVFFGLLAFLSVGFLLSSSTHSFFFLVDLVLVGAGVGVGVSPNILPKKLSLVAGVFACFSDI